MKTQISTRQASSTKEGLSINLFPLLVVLLFQIGCGDNTLSNFYETLVATNGDDTSSGEVTPGTDPGDPDDDGSNGSGNGSGKGNGFSDPEYDGPVFKLDEVLVIDNTHIKVRFQNSLSRAEAEITGNYQITSADGGIEVRSVSRDSADASMVSITTSSQAPGHEYTLTARNLVDAEGAQINTNKNRGRFIGSANPDLSQPTLQGVYSGNAGTIQLTYSEALGSDLGSATVTICTVAPAPTCPGPNTVAVTPSYSVDPVNPSRLIVSYTPELTPGQTYYATVAGIDDPSGNTVTAGFLAFTAGDSAIDSEAPTISAAYAQGNDTIVLLFSEELDASTVTKSDFEVNGATPQSVEVIGSAVYLSLSSNMSGGQAMSVVVDGTVTDVAGNENTPGVGDWANFTYRTNDTQSPKVLQVEATGNKEITVTFSEPIELGSATDHDNYVFPAKTGIVVNDTKDIECTSSAPYQCVIKTSTQSGQTLAVEISGIEDAAGNTISNSTYSFVGDAKPTVTSIVSSSPNTFVLYFNEALASASTDPQDYLIDGLDNFFDSVAFTPGDNYITLTGQQQSPGEAYALTLAAGAGIKDNNGNNVNSASIPPAFGNNGAPYVTKVYSNMPGYVIVEFSEAVNSSAAVNPESALNSSNYQVDGGPCTGCSVSLLTATSVIIDLGASAPGADGTVSLEVSSDIEDLDGVNVAAPGLNKVFHAGSNRVFAIGDNGLILRSTNGGTDWSYIPSDFNGDLNALAFTSNTRGIIVGDNGAILRTTDGATFNEVTSPTNKDLHDVFFVDAQNGWAVGEGGVIIVTDDGGQTWTKQTSDVAVNLNDVYFQDADTGWAVGDEGTLLKTTDGGSTWISTQIAGEENLNSITPAGANELYVVGDYGTILKNDGFSFYWEEQDSNSNDNFKDVAFVSADEGWAVGLDGSLLYTTDGGNEWSTVSSGTGADITSISVNSDGEAVAVTSAGEVLIYNGSSWSNNGPIDTGGAGDYSTTDTSAGDILSIASLDNTTIRVTFSDLVLADGSARAANNPNNYDLDGLSIVSIDCSAGYYCDITTSTQALQSYDVTIPASGRNIADQAGVNLGSDINDSGIKLTGSVSVDNSPPSVTAVTPVDENTILVTFSEGVDPETALLEGNYTFDPDINIYNIATTDDPSVIALTVSYLEEGSSYDLTVDNIADLNGNAMTEPSTAESFDGVNVSSPYILNASSETTTTVDIVFSEAVDPDSLDDTNFSNIQVTYDHDANPATPEISVDIQSLSIDPTNPNVVNLTLDAAMTGGNDYTVTVNNATDSAGNYIGGPNVFTFTAADLPDVTVGLDVTVTETDTGVDTVAQVTVTLDQAAGQDVTVEFYTDNSTPSGDAATPATDYTEVPSGTPQTLTFAPGVVSQTINIDVLGDGLVENQESFHVIIQNALLNASPLVITDDRAEVFIDDNDVLPAIASITSADGDGNYNSGDPIDITVTFSAAVELLTDNLEINLSNGETITVSAPFGPSTTFSSIYTVLPTDNTGLDVSSITLAGAATLEDAFTNPADLSLPAGANLADNVTIVLDNISPAAPSGLDLAAADDTGVDNSDDRTRRINNLTISGTAEANATVEVKEGAGVLATTTADGGGNWTADIALSGEGPHNITATATDAAGNASSDSTALVITIDRTAADESSNLLAGSNAYLDINLDQAVYGGDGTSVVGVDAADFSLVFNQNGGTVTGVSISSVRQNDNTVEGSASALVGGETELRLFLNVSGTVAGTETISVSTVATSVYDNSGNSSSFTVGPKTLSVLGVANILTASLAADNSYVDITFDEAAYTTTGSSGALVPTDFTIDFQDNGGIAGVTVSSFTNTSGGGLVGGELTIRANLAGYANATGSETIQFTANSNEIYSSADQATPNSETSGVLTFNDLAAPAAPTGLDLAAADDSGLLNSDNYTATTTGLTVSGSAEDGSTVELFVDAASQGTTTASGGTFSFDIALAAGSTYAITATATDGASNASGASSALNITVDTTAPAAAPSSAPDLAAADDSGQSTSDNITNNTSLTFEAGAGTVEANAVVEFYDGTTLLDSGQAAADGSYSISADLSSLANAGATVITTKQVDLAGNRQNTASSGLSVTIDTIAPGAAPSAAPDLEAADDSGPSNSDDYTSGTSLTFEASAGTVEGNATVEFFDGAVSLGSDTAGADGSYSITLNLAALADTGANTITTVQFDVAGNGPTASSAGLSLTIDTGAPSAPIAAPDMAAADDSGPSNSDNITSNTTVTFNGAAGTVDANATVGFYDGGSLIDSGTAAADGSYSISIDLSGIANSGPVSITTRQTDLAGNGPSADSAGLAVTVDTVNPTISSVAPATSANVNSTLVSYTLSENCGSASITWTRTGGSADPGSPHAQALTGSELNAGINTDISITNNPTLVDSAVYSIDWDCTDRAGNIATTVQSTGVTFTDAPLQIVNAVTVDRDGNGKIDAYRVTFNKSVNDSTFPGYQANANGTVTSDWLVAGYTNVRLVHGSAVSWNTDTPNDATLFIGFAESLTSCNASDQAGCDTGAKPDLTTTATPALEDAATNVIAQVAIGDVTEADGAEPILVTAKSLGATSVDVVFSEAVEQTTAETNAFYSIDNGITVSNAARDGSDLKVVHLTTSAQTGGQTYTLDVNNDVKDLANFNLSASADTVTFDGLVKPVVVNIVTVNTNTLTITFNEDIVASTAECTNLTTCAAIYSNGSLPVKSAVSVAGSGVNDDQFTLTVNDMIEGQNYTTSVVEGSAQSVASSETMGSTNNSATFTGDGRPSATISVDTETSCPSDNTANGVLRRVVVQYDQTVGASALTATNYKINLCITGDCTSGTGSPNADGAALVTDQGANKYYVDFTDSFDSDSSQYQLQITGVMDSTGNEVPAPTNLGFQCGNDTTPPSLIAADVISANVTATQVMLTFSETVDSVTANVASNYQYDTEGYGTNVNSAARQTNTAQVLVTFNPGLAEGGHQIRVQNVEDTAATPNAIVDNGINNVQPIIVNAPEEFQDGPVFEDPFNDGTTAGYVVIYDDKIYLGADSNSAKLFEVDFGLTQSQTILVDADGTPGSPVEDFFDYVSGSSGTIKGVDNLYAACLGGSSSPSMTGSACSAAGGIEKLFIGSLNISGNYISYWDTTDVSSSTTTFTFNEGVNPDPGGGFAYRSTVFIVFKDYLWNHFGAEAGGGGRGGRICVNPSGCAANSLSEGQGIRQRPYNFARIGNQPGGTDIYNGSKASITGDNYLTAIDVAYEYDNDGIGPNESQLYLANGGVYTGTLGSVRTADSDGGIIRSRLAYSTLSSLPPDCSVWTAGCDAYWEDVTPDASSNNTDWTDFVSIPLPENSAVTGAANCGTGTVEMDCTQPYNIFVPAMKAIPYMRAAPNGDLYMLRNACSSQQVCTNGAADITGFGGCEFRTERQVCPSGSEVPQLWMMPANCGTAGTCANAWQLVAEYSTTGKTNMQGNTTECNQGGDICANNTHATLLEFVGDYMYVGFDNATDGANIWRTDMSSVSSGSLPTETSFELVNIPGLDGTATNQKIFSHIAINDNGTDWLILTTRDGSNAMQIYRTANGNQ